MRVGIALPQGWVEPFTDVHPRAAWARMVSAARTAETLGFESAWVFDHFHRWPRPNGELVFESFTAITGIAGVTHRIRLGHLVACAGYRNAALVAKMISTLDVISDGRADLGIGAGWYEDEWRAYGYDFPTRAARLATLRDQIQVIRAMLTAGAATYDGPFARVQGAVNEPKPINGHLPIMVGGNGPEVTWRIAAHYADELNLDGLTPEATREALPTIVARCEEIGRDPATLRVSVHIFGDRLGIAGSERIDRLGEYASLGVSRVMAPPPGLTQSDEVLYSLVDDCRAAGVELADS
jgi:F420-dependent oxidoreductase-like protein